MKEIVETLISSAYNKLPQKVDLRNEDVEYVDSWKSDLITDMQDDYKILLKIIRQDSFDEGEIIIDNNKFDEVLRSCTAIRLDIRNRLLSKVSDEELETGDLNSLPMEKKEQGAFLAYIFLANIQELIIENS
tara:strand:+ start:417 stop:812 length:396 start_codon:yes stop_codon:yes gene_type:complete